MNDPAPDDDLHALFARQRAADRGRTPGFSAMRRRVPGAKETALPSIPPAWRWALPGAAALALALVPALHHFTKSPAASQAALARELAEIDAALRRSLAAQNSLTAWQSPTDFLLNPTHENTP